MHFFSYEIINNDDDDDKKEKSMEIFRRKQIEKKNGENLKSDFYLFFIRGSDKNWKRLLWLLLQNDFVNYFGIVRFLFVAID